MREEWLELSLCTLEFPLEFLRDWLLQVLPKDGSGSIYWELVFKLAIAKPDVALAIALKPGLEISEPGRALRVKIFGALRYRTILGSPADLALGAELTRLQNAPAAEDRIDFLRTYAAPLWDALVPVTDFEELMESLDRMPSPEKGVGFELALAAINAPKAPIEQKHIALCWLKRHAHPQCSPEQKYRVAHAVWIGGESVDPGALGFDPFELNLAIQPLTADEKGIWREIEHALHGTLHGDPERFRKNLRALANKHWGSLRKIISDDKGLSWVFGELAQTGWGPGFITELYDSSEEGDRRLGRFLFESLRMPAPAEAGPIFTPEAFRRWLAEFQSGTVYQSVATQLLTAAPRVDPEDVESVSLFQQEAYFQCINLPGLCLEKLRPHVTSLPMLKPVIDSADAYFKTLAGLNDSAIKAQQIPGIRRYMLRKARLDRRRLEEEVERHSIFAPLVSKSYLLYGNQHAYVTDGKLSAPSGLHNISTSFELPRLETIAPEQCQMRRLNALVYLAQLRKQAGPPEETE